jgi:hypothetical protein
MVMAGCAVPPFGCPIHVVHLLFSPLYSRQKIPACRESAYGKDEEIPYLAMRPTIRACFAKE